MSRLETVNGDNWRDFTGAGRAVLVLGKSDCAACKQWIGELDEFLASDERWANVRFGKVTLDQPGLTDFKRGNKWLAEVTVLPFNVIYADGERAKTFAGGGLQRLENRLQNLEAQILPTQD